MPSRIKQLRSVQEKKFYITDLYFFGLDKEHNLFFFSAFAHLSEFIYVFKALTTAAGGKNFTTLNSVFSSLQQKVFPVKGWCWILLPNSCCRLILKATGEEHNRKHRK